MRAFSYGRIALICVLAAGCNSTPKNTQTKEASIEYDSNLGNWVAAPQRSAAAESDRRDSYAHQGSHNFNPGTSRGPIAIDTNDKARFKQDLSAFKDPKAESENYEYQTNREDVVARHTFVLAGADRSIGHHVAFFESRHQHHAIVKLEFDFTGAGLKPGTVNAAELVAGKTLFEGKIKKEGSAGVPALPQGTFYAVQVSPLNPEFELVTIPTGITRTFLGSLATITSDGKVSRFNQKGSDVIVKISNVFHFSRMYVKEFPESLQYMAFSVKAAGNASRFVLAHVIQGTLPNSRPDGSLNIEQMLEAELVAPSGVEVKDGSIVQIENRAVDQLLKPDDEVEAHFFRDGLKEVSDPRATPLVKFKVRKVVYNRPVGIDAGQDAVRMKVRGM